MIILLGTWGTLVDETDIPALMKRVLVNNKYNKCILKYFKSTLEGKKHYGQMKEQGSFKE